METTKIPTQYFGAKTLDRSRAWTNDSPLFPAVHTSLPLQPEVVPEAKARGSSTLNGMHLRPSKRSDTAGTCYMGLDWRGLSSSLPIQPNETLIFCDLRGAVFDDLDLSSVEFFGCRLDGTSFRAAHLHEVRFIGCFSSEQSPPTDFRGTVWQDSYAIECHLNVAKHSDLERGASQEVPSFCEWPTLVVEAANQTLSESHKVREQAVILLGKLGNPVVAPYLANLLLDDHWKVRVATVHALAQLCDHVTFFYRDQVLLKWLFLALGDKHPKVRHTTRRLIKKLQPSSEILRFSIQRMSAQESEQKLAGLYAAAELCKLNQLERESGDDSRRWVILQVHKLLEDESAKVREAALSLLKMMDDQSTVDWVLERLSDPVARVRAQAIRTLGWIAGAASANHIAPLLSDPDEEVRTRTLYTLRNVGQLQPNHVAEVLADESPAVRRVARELLASWNGITGSSRNESD
ncbi:MAG: HEAT repeat domain-containing protein [Ardenticatenaceae bacterium]